MQEGLEINMYVEKCNLLIALRKFRKDSADSVNKELKKFYNDTL